MTLTQLRYLIAIADAGMNITQAAERVHATQPGLSKQLKQLEDELGFLLFVRKGRSLEAITPEGRQIIERARSIQAEADNIRAFAANRRRESRGSLTLVTTHTQARYVLPTALARLKQDYPDLSLHLKPVGEGEALGLVERGEADLALVSSAGAAPGGGLAVPLFRWQRVVLVPATHHLAALKRSPSLAELAREQLVSYESSTRPESSLRQAFEHEGLSPNVALTARDADLIKTYVRAGLGVGILAEMALLPEDSKDLVALPAPPAIPECTAYAVLPRERVLRDYSLDLLLALAPQLDRIDLRRALEGVQAPNWPLAPTWGGLATG
jgi:DNA-binding transcriptional LysR family regulator